MGLAEGYPELPPTVIRFSPLLFPRSCGGIHIIIYLDGPRLERFYFPALPSFLVTHVSVLTFFLFPSRPPFLFWLVGPFLQYLPGYGFFQVRATGRHGLPDFFCSRGRKGKFRRSLPSRYPDPCRSFRPRLGQVAMSLFHSGTALEIFFTFPGSSFFGLPVKEESSTCLACCGRVQPPFACDCLGLEVV